jgi:hypothetical protein
MNASITDRFIFNIGNIIGKIKINPGGQVNDKVNSKPVATTGFEGQ